MIIPASNDHEMENASEKFVVKLSVCEVREIEAAAQEFAGMLPAPNDRLE